MCVIEGDYMIKSIIYSCVFLFAISGAANCFADDPMTIETGIDRSGSDFTSFWQKSASPEICRSACLSDKKCQAWTSVKPGVQGKKARCYLKNSIPKPRKNACCTSGVRQTKTLSKNLNLKLPVFAPKAKPVAPMKNALPLVIMQPTLKMPKGVVGGKTGTAPTRTRPSTSTAQTPSLIPNIPNVRFSPTPNAAFIRLKSKRNRAIQEALEKAQKQKEQQEATRREMRRRASANTGYPSQPLDCDDSDPGVHPNQNEVCNYKDDNCNGLADEGVMLTVYRDADGDSFGNPDEMTRVCAMGDGLIGMSLNALDCDDTDVRKNPAAGTCN
jgi:hypothetical protein